MSKTAKASPFSSIRKLNFYHNEKQKILTYQTIDGRYKIMFYRQIIFFFPNWFTMCSERKAQVVQAKVSIHLKTSSNKFLTVCKDAELLGRNNVNGPAFVFQI